VVEKKAENRMPAEGEKLTKGNATAGPKRAGRCLVIGVKVLAELGENLLRVTGEKKKRKAGKSICAT